MRDISALRGKRVTVLGAGRTGLAAVKALHKLGVLPLLADEKPLQNIEASTQELLQELGIPLQSHASPQTALPPETALLITSPGVPKENPILRAALERNIPIWSEIELAFRLTTAPIVGVTGTNGKTTTAVLLAAILREAHIPNILCGNISADNLKKTLVEAALQAAEAPEPPTLVAEISSFQLEWIERFAPKVGVLTNITPDHLDRYRSFEEYALTKARLFMNQTANDCAVLNAEDPATSALPWRQFSASCCWFSRKRVPSSGYAAAWVQDGAIFYRSALGECVRVLSLDTFPPTLPGAHNVENVLAATCAAHFMGAPLQAVAEAVRHFRGVPHRMEHVAEIEGVIYINNSMCTNVAAAIQSLEAISQPTIVIAGGAEKNLDYTPLVPVLRARAKAVVLIGQTAERMEQIFQKGGVHPVFRASSLEEAVQCATSLASSGDVVLLCPACASFDMFSNFEQRGEAFRQIVYRLQREKQL